MKELIRSQEGALGMILVIGFMALAVPLITSSLVLSGALTQDSVVKTDIMKRHYAALGVGEYVGYLAAEPTRWNNWKTANFVPASGNYQETITLGGESTDVTVIPVAVSPGNAPPIPLSPLQTQLSANPAALLEGQDLTLTLTVTNPTTSLEDLTKIYIGLPPGFRYHEGSTTGVTTDNPTKTIMSSLFSDTPDYDLVTWDLTYLNLQLQPAQSVTLSFVAHTSDPEGDEEGNFCVRGWVGSAGGVPSTGSTVQVTLGEAYEPCVDNRLKTATTVSPQVVPSGSSTPYVFTYTTTIQNVGTETQFLTGFRDVLAPGFTYKTWSTSGDLGTTDPARTLLIDGRWELNWTFPSEISVPPGGTKTLVFQAEAQPGMGNYYNEAIPFYKGQCIKINKQSDVVGDLVCTNDRKVMLKGNVDINGEVRSEGQVRLHQNAVVKNDVVSNGDIKLQQNAVISGNAASAGQVTLQAGATVSGTMLEQATGLIILPPALSTPPLPPFLTGGGADITVPNGAPVTLLPGSYGKLKIEKMATLILKAGQYSFEEVRAQHGAVIAVDVIDGSIVVDVAKDLKFDKQFAMSISNGSPSDVLYRTRGGIVLKKQGDFEGTFLALGGEKQAAYTWPSAAVRVMDVFQVTTTNAQGEIGSFEQWVGADSSFVYRSTIDR